MNIIYLIYGKQTGKHGYIKQKDDGGGKTCYYV